MVVAAATSDIGTKELRRPDQQTNLLNPVNYSGSMHVSVLGLHPAPGQECSPCGQEKLKIEPV
jgi:hypothetical protein